MEIKPTYCYHDFKFILTMYYWIQIIFKRAKNCPEINHFQFCLIFLLWKIIFVHWIGSSIAALPFKPLKTLRSKAQGSFQHCLNEKKIIGECFKSISLFPLVSFFLSVCLSVCCLPLLICCLFVCMLANLFVFFSPLYVVFLSCSFFPNFVCLFVGHFIYKYFHCNLFSRSLSLSLSLSLSILSLSF